MTQTCLEIKHKHQKRIQRPSVSSFCDEPDQTQEGQDIPGKCPEGSTIFALKHALLPRMVGSTPIDSLENRSRGDCELSMIENTDHPDSDVCAAPYSDKETEP